MYKIDDIYEYDIKTYSDRLETGPESLMKENIVIFIYKNFKSTKP